MTGASFERHIFFASICPCAHVQKGQWVEVQGSHISFWKQDTVHQKTQANLGTRPFHFGHTNKFAFHSTPQVLIHTTLKCINGWTACCSITSLVCPLKPSSKQGNNNNNDNRSSSSNNDKQSVFMFLSTLFIHIVADCAFLVCRLLYY